MARTYYKSSIDIGLDLSALSLKPGQTRSRAELAVWCGCSKERIRQLEEQALTKLRNALEEKENKYRPKLVA